MDPVSFFPTAGKQCEYSTSSSAVLLFVFHVSLTHIAPGENLNDKNKFLLERLLEFQDILQFQKHDGVSSMLQGPG